MAKGSCGPLGCRNKQIFFRQAGSVFPPNYENMKEELFPNQTGASITLTKVTPVNFIVLIARNGMDQTEGVDYNRVGQIVTFTDPLVNDNIRTVYF